MQKAWLVTNNQGFSLVEVILAGSIFALIMTALVGAFLYGQESTALSGQRARAVLLAQEGLEVARNMRDEDFSNLTNGVYGLAIAGNQWIFSGSEDVTDVFTRQITISTVNSDIKQASVNVSWQQNEQRTGAVALVTYLTNWARTIGQDEGLMINIAGVSLAAGNKELRGITLENIGEIDIVIDTITVIWNNSNLIEEIKIDNTRVWKHNNEGSPDGRQPSGTELDVEDLTLVQGAGVIDIDKFKFDGNMTGNTFNITIELNDGSTKSTGSFSP